MKLTILPFLVLLFNNTYAQVGVNTETPKQTFHIDPKSNTTETPTASLEEDDFVVTSEGKVGIGILNPEYNLHAKGTIAFPTVPTEAVGGSYSAVGINRSTGKLGYFTPGSQPLFVRRTATTRTTGSWSNVNNRVVMPINTAAVDLINTAGIVSGTDAGREYIQVTESGTYRIEVSSIYYACLNSTGGNHYIHVDIEKNTGSGWSVVDSPRTILAATPTSNVTYTMNSILYIAELETNAQIGFRMRAQETNSSSNCGFGKPGSSSNSLVVNVTKL